MSVSIDRRAKSVLTVDNSLTEFRIKVIPSEWRFGTALDVCQGDHVSAQVLILESLCSCEGLKVEEICNHNIKMAKSLFPYRDSSYWGEISNIKDANEVKHFLENFGTKFVEDMNLIPTLTHKRVIDEMAVREEVMKHWKFNVPLYLFKQYYCCLNDDELKNEFKEECAATYSDFSDQLNSMVDISINISRKEIDLIYQDLISCNDDFHFFSVTKDGEANQHWIILKEKIREFKLAAFKSYLVSEMNDDLKKKKKNEVLKENVKNAIDEMTSLSLQTDTIKGGLYFLAHKLKEIYDKSAVVPEEFIFNPKRASKKRSAAITKIFRHLISILESQDFQEYQENYFKNKDNRSSLFFISDKDVVFHCMEYYLKVLQELNSLTSFKDSVIRNIHTKIDLNDKRRYEALLTRGDYLFNWLKDIIPHKKSNESQAIANLRFMNQLIKLVDENNLGLLPEKPANTILCRYKLVKNEVSRIGKLLFNKCNQQVDKRNWTKLVGEEDYGLTNCLGDNIYKLFDFPFIDNYDSDTEDLKDASRPSNDRQFEILCEVASRHMVLIYHAFPSFQKLNKVIREAIHNRFLEHILTKGLWKNYIGEYFGLDWNTVSCSNVAFDTIVELIDIKKALFSFSDLLKYENCRFQLKSFPKVLLSHYYSEQFAMVCRLWTLTLAKLKKKNGFETIIIDTIKSSRRDEINDLINHGGFKKSIIASMLSFYKINYGSVLIDDLIASLVKISLEDGVKKRKLEKEVLEVVIAFYTRDISLTKDGFELFITQVGDGLGENNIPPIFDFDYYFGQDSNVISRNFLNYWIKKRNDYEISQQCLEFVGNKASVVKFSDNVQKSYDSFENISIPVDDDDDTISLFGACCWMDVLTAVKDFSSYEEIFHCEIGDLVKSNWIIEIDEDDEEE